MLDINHYKGVPKPVPPALPPSLDAASKNTLNNRRKNRGMASTILTGTLGGGSNADTQTLLG